MHAKLLPPALTATAVSLLLLTGCVVAPVARPVYRAPPPAVVYQQPAPVVIQQQPAIVVYQEPPPPQVEVIGFAPAPGYFWISGVWLWEGNRHVWRPGHWEPQRNGQVYVPHQWARVGASWQLSGGLWRR